MLTFSKYSIQTYVHMKDWNHEPHIIFYFQVQSQCFAQCNDISCLPSDSTGMDDKMDGFTEEHYIIWVPGCGICGARCHCKFGILLN